MMWHLMNILVIIIIILFFRYNKTKYIKEWKQEPCF